MSILCYHNFSFKKKSIAALQSALLFLYKNHIVPQTLKSHHSRKGLLLLLLLLLLFTAIGLSPRGSSPTLVKIKQ
jgi:hypothetical protein